MRVSVESEHLPPSSPNSSAQDSSGPGSSGPAGVPDRELSRRRALAKLGLAAAAAYVAPTVVHLDRSARAVQPSCTGGKANGNPWCNTNNG